MTTTYAATCSFIEDANMLNKLPEEYLYEYVVSYEGDEIAVYYSDATPPEIGTLINPWEFVSSKTTNEKSLNYKGPYRVIEVSQQPKNMDGNNGDVSAQTLVNLIVGK
jgi:hypothetical protein